MEKKQSQSQQKTTSLKLRTETLRRLDDAQLRAVSGGGRLRVPGGDETTVDDTTG
jgi:hypothetical protein